MSEWKKPRATAPSAWTVPPSPPQGLASLPHVLADAIVSYVVEDVAFDFGTLPADKPVIPVAVYALASVSKSWCAALDEVACCRALRSLELKQEGDLTRSSMLSMRNRLTLRRAWTRRLTIRHTSLFPVESSEGLWSAALAHVPLLTDLKLCEPLSRSGDSQERVVRAAARQCPLVETLVLPDRQYPRGFENDRVLDDLVSTVFESAAVWKRRLTRLRMTLDNYASDAAITRDYINCVLETCPNIQVLDGYAGSVWYFALYKCEEQWILDLKTWRRFCRTCTQMREFNWICLPFATAFFEVFGRYSKPQLKKLTLMQSAGYEWERYLYDIDEHTKQKLETSGYGPTAKNARAVLKACPALEELTVRWHNAGKEMDIEIFGDDFVLAVVNSCRRLTNLTIAQVNPEDFLVPTVQSLTDRSLQALCRLPDLAKVKLSGCNITGAGLMSLVMGGSPNRCRFQLRLGEYSDKPASLKFDHALIDFLERLLSYSGPLRRRVSLHFINDKVHWLDERQCLSTITKVQRLCQRVLAKHPVLRLHGLVTVVGETGQESKRLREFAVVTDAAPPPDWNAGSCGIPDVKVDSVLVLRRLLGAEDSRDGVGN